MATAPAQSQFQKPDLEAMPIIQKLSPQDKDAYQRVVAAGIKLMYAPETRQQLQQAVASKDPVPKKLAENVCGLVLMLDQKTKGGIPGAAIFPAAIELLGEAAEVLIKAGQPVTQANYHDASILLYTMLGKKMGFSDKQLMDGAAQGLQSGGGQAAAQPEAQTAPAVPQGQRVGMLGTRGAQ